VSDSLIHKVLKSGAWNAFANAIIKFNLLILTFLSSVVLDGNDFGRFALILSTLMSFQIFASLGLTTTAAKFVSLHINSDEEKNRILPAIFLVLSFFSIVSCSVLFFYSEEISIVALEDPTLSPLIKIISIGLFFASLKSVLTGTLQGAMKFRKITKCNLLSLFISIPIYISLLLGFSLTGAIVGLVLIEFTFALFLLLSAIKEKCVSFNFFNVEIHSINEVLLFTLPISLSGMLVMPVNWYLLKEISINYGYLEVGLLNILNQWQAILVFLPLSLGTVMLPQLAKNKNKKESYFKIAKLAIIFSLITSSMFFILGEKIIYHYNSQYSSYLSLTMMVAFLLTLILLPLNNLLVNYSLSLGKPLVLTFSNLVWCIITLFLFTRYIGATDVLSLVFYVRFIAYLCSSIVIVILLYTFKSKSKSTEL
jgi:O-antigen/teichoic acid export membrane protein